MKCSRCGTENRAEARFCQQCGAPLPTAPPAPEVGAVPEAPDAQAKGAEEAPPPDAPVVEPPAGAPHEPGVAASAPAPAQTPETGLEAEETRELAEPPLCASDADAPDGVEPATMDGSATTDRSATTDGSATGAVRALEERSGAVEPAPDQGVPEVEGTVSPQAPAGEPVGGSAAQAQEGSAEPMAQAGSAAEETGELLSVGEESETSVPVEPNAGSAGESPALAAGTVLAGRYRVVEVLVSGPEERVYRARDLRRCPQCGFDGNSPDQAFCDACGAVLDTKPFVTLLERADAEGQTPEGDVLDHFVEGGRAFWVWLEERTQTDVLVDAEEPMRMVIGQLSDPGRLRELDEDSLFVMTMSRTLESVEHTIALFVVADGMGGHEGGEVASRIAIQVLGEGVLQGIFAPELAGAARDDDSVRAAMVRAVQEANAQVFLERERRQTDMGTTMTVALLVDRTLYLAHVGDCRAYRWGSDGLQQLTTDHSVVASMVASGAARPEEIYTHPQRSVIYRCIGDSPNVEVDTAIHPAEPGDRLVLCCDGLWEMLRDEGIEEVLLAEPEPQRACRVMVDRANQAGGPDNISVIVVQL